MHCLLLAFVASLLLGMRHATDADHIVAVTTIINARARKPELIERISFSARRCRVSVEKASASAASTQGDGEHQSLAAAQHHDLHDITRLVRIERVAVAV